MLVKADTIDVNKLRRKVDRLQVQEHVHKTHLQEGVEAVQE